MIKAPKYFIVASLALMTLAGCGNDDNVPDAIAKASPDFSATIGECLATRATDNTWEAGDMIGISAASVANVCYLTAGADGRFSVKNSSENIYFKDEKEVTFTAYYPWTATIGEQGTIAADTEQQTLQTSFDYLWARASGSRQKPQVAFDFAHKMSKVVITLRRGDNVSYIDLIDSYAWLDGLRHKGSFTIADGRVLVDSSADRNDNWEFSESSVAILSEELNEVSYSFIFFPQKLDAPLSFVAELPNVPGASTNENTVRTTIDFTEANRVKDGQQARNELVGGRQYNINIRLHRSGCVIESSDISAWNNVDEGEISVD